MTAHYKLTVNVPISYVDAVRKAIGDAGAGRAEHYTHCSFSIRGYGRFTPGPDAQPHIGQPGVCEVVEEEQIQTVVTESDLKAVLKAMREAHPYEEIGFEVIPILDTAEFFK